MAAPPRTRADSLEHDTEYQVRRRAAPGETDQSETHEVLMAILLACWRWLLPAPRMPASPAPAAGTPAAAALAARTRRRPLAPIHAPLPRLLS